MSEPTPPNSSSLSVLLALAGAFACTVFLVLLTGGLFLYVVLFTLAILAFGGLHYCIWGRMLTRYLAREMEEERLLEQARDRLATREDDRYSPR